MIRPGRCPETLSPIEVEACENEVCLTGFRPSYDSSAVLALFRARRDSMIQRRAHGKFPVALSSDDQHGEPCSGSRPRLPRPSQSQRQHSDSTDRPARRVAMYQCGMGIKSSRSTLLEDRKAVQEGKSGARATCNLQTSCPKDAAKRQDPARQRDQLFGPVKELTTHFSGDARRRGAPARSVSGHTGLATECRVGNRRRGLGKFQLEVSGFPPAPAAEPFMP
eukprot:441905-Hanusia_phi.AAC.3